MKMRHFGEFRFIGEIRRGARRDRSVTIGIGDDTAVLKTHAGFETLFTTDMLVESVHFRLKDASAYEIGRKAMNVNVSDIAAMGGIPTHAVAAVGLPGGLPVSFARQLVKGLKEAAKQS